MANRMIDTIKVWDLLLDVDTSYRLFYIYLHTNCDHGGIIKPKKALVDVYCGDVDIWKAKQELSDRNLIIFLDNGNWFLPEFIKSNYKNLPENKSNAAKSCIAILKENNIDISTLNQPLKKGSLTLIDKDIDIGKDIELGIINNGVPNFEESAFDFDKDFWTPSEQTEYQSQLIPCQHIWVKLTEIERKKVQTHIKAYVKSEPDAQYRSKPLKYLEQMQWMDSIKEKETKKELTPMEKLKLSHEKT